MVRKSLLLAGAALIVFGSAPPVFARPGGIELAQAAPEKNEKKEEHKPEPGKSAPPQQRPAPPAPPPQQPHAAPPAPPPPQPHPQAAPPPSPQQPRPAQVAPPPPPHEPQRAAPSTPPPHEQRPAQLPPPPAQHEQRPAAAPPPPAEHERRPAQVPAPATPQPQRPVQAPPAAVPTHEPPRSTQAPATTPPPQPQQPAQTPSQAPRPAEATPPGAPTRQHGERPGQAAPTTPPQQTQTAPQGPRGPGQPGQPQPPTQAAPAALPPASAPPPPQQPRDTSQFIRQPGQGPTRTIQDLRQERQQVQQGNTTIIREGDRTIVREGDRTIIRHEEADRFAVGARDVRSERRGNETVTVIVRPNGDQIITVLDLDGRLLRRVRREPNGREIVIIDEGFAGPRRDDYILAVPPPRLTLPPERYYVDLDRAPRERIYETLVAPPLERFESRYTIGQVRYNASLRMLMARIDLDINFDSGSWSLTPDQIDKLSVIADAMNRAVQRNPREVFLVEGHTDAVGTPEDNLSLSDRRAESVAVALSQQFGVPPENMVTQGYGQEELKVQTAAAERANRRVAVRRITPLLQGYAAR